MQVVLVMFRNDGERRSFSVVRNMTVIGRREDCDLRIPVSDVSRKHCRLVRTDDGIRVEDLGSSNGTYVNAERIQESELKAGDVLGVGPVFFIVQIDSVPRDEEMEPPINGRAAHLAPPEPPRSEDSVTELTPLEELPAEEEFSIQDDAPPIEEEPLTELDELPAAEPASMEPLSLDDDVLDRLPSAPPVAAAEPAPKPPVEAVVGHESVSEVVPLDDFEELNLEEIPVPTPQATTDEADPAPVAMEAIAAAPVHQPSEEIEELELDEAELLPDAATGAGEPTPSAGSQNGDLEQEQGELEFDDFALEPVAPVVEAPLLEVPAAEIPLTEVPLADAPVPQLAPIELAATEPAYDEVSIESGPDEFEELTLDQEPAPKSEAGESSWDFVIEESDNTRSHHDFKLDLDSPHEQTHG